MLTKKDIEMIRTTREDVRNNREKDIVLIGESIVGRHPITGEPVKEDVRFELGAVVTEVSLRTSVDRYRHDGIEIRTGDVIVDISYEDISFEITNDEIEYLDYDNVRYTVLSADKLGLGGYNRVEILGRRTQ